MKCLDVVALQRYSAIMAYYFDFIHRKVGNREDWWQTHDSLFRS